MIYTTSFSNYRKLPPTTIPVAITATVPDYYEGLRFEGLAPSDILLGLYNDQQDCELFKTLYYRECLVDLKPAEIYEKLTSIGNGRDVCLLTYEDSYNTDNVRNILIGWFTNAGLPCEEIKFRRNDNA